jgi:hypothetical protein
MIVAQTVMRNLQKCNNSTAAGRRNRLPHQDSARSRQFCTQFAGPGGAGAFACPNFASISGTAKESHG